MRNLFPDSACCHGVGAEHVHVEHDRGYKQLGLPSASALGGDQLELLVPALRDGDFAAKRMMQPAYLDRVDCPDVHAELLDLLGDLERARRAAIRCEHSAGVRAPAAHALTASLTDEGGDLRLF